MPVRSKRQWGWLAIHRPDLLHKWQHEAPRDYAKLPDSHSSDRHIHKHRRKPGPK